METCNEKYCVYVLTFPNGKHYVGISKNIKHRWASDGAQYNAQLVGKAIKKYGWGNISHGIIAHSLTKEEACNVERLLIATLLTTDIRYGYNQTIGGEGVAGWERTDAWRKQHSEDMKGAKNPNYGKDFRGVNHPGCKPLYQISKQLEIIKRWNYIMEVTEVLGYDNSNIGKCCNNKAKTAYGFYWCFECDLNDFLSRKRTEMPKKGIFNGSS